MYVYHIDLYKLVTLMRRWAVQKTLLAFDVRVCGQGRTTLASEQVFIQGVSYKACSHARTTLAIATSRLSHFCRGLSIRYVEKKVFRFQVWFSLQRKYKCKRNGTFLYFILI